MTPAVRFGERAASKRKLTAVSTLLTFCPPGPEARLKLSLSSERAIDIWSVTRIMPGREYCVARSETILKMSRTVCRRHEICSAHP